MCMLIFWMSRIYMSSDLRIEINKETEDQNAILVKKYPVSSASNSNPKLDVKYYGKDAVLVEKFDFIKKIRTKEIVKYEYNQRQPKQIDNLQNNHVKMPSLNELNINSGDVTSDFINSEVSKEFSSLKTNDNLDKTNDNLNKTIRKVTFKNDLQIIPNQSERDGFFEDKNLQLKNVDDVVSTVNKLKDNGSFKDSKQKNYIIKKAAEKKDGTYSVTSNNYRTFSCCPSRKPVENVKNDQELFNNPMFKKTNF